MTGSRAESKNRWEGELSTDDENEKGGGGGENFNEKGKVLVAKVKNTVMLQHRHGS